MERKDVALARFHGTRTWFHLCHLSVRSIDMPCGSQFVKRMHSKKTTNNFRSSHTVFKKLICIDKGNVQIDREPNSFYRVWIFRASNMIHGQLFQATGTKGTVRNMQAARHQLPYIRSRANSATKSREKTASEIATLDLDRGTQQNKSSGGRSKTFPFFR